TPTISDGRSCGLARAWSTASANTPRRVSRRSFSAPGFEPRSERLNERKEQTVSTIRYSQTTTATPEQFIAALTDFGPGREKLFDKSADSYLEAHSQGPHEADVTRGSRG